MIINGVKNKESFIILLQDKFNQHRITWDWRHAFCHKACRLTNHGYGKASFTPVPDGIRHERKSQGRYTTAY
jgi:hypothetical protein